MYGDLPKGNLRWSHWEQIETGLVSVFRFDVPKPHRIIRWNSVASEASLFQEFTAYHGELTSIRRWNHSPHDVDCRSRKEGAEIAEAELMVEYGPVELGGKKYFCPVRSISVSRAPGEVQRIASAQPRSHVPWTRRPMVAGEGAPLQTMLNETTFDNYHLFRAEAEILSAGNSGGGSIPNAPCRCFVPIRRNTFSSSDAAGERYEGICRADRAH